MSLFLVGEWGGCFVLFLDTKDRRDGCLLEGVAPDIVSGFGPGFTIMAPLSCVVSGGQYCLVRRGENGVSIRGFFDDVVEGGIEGGRVPFLGWKARRFFQLVEGPVETS